MRTTTLLALAAAAAVLMTTACVPLPPPLTSSAPAPQGAAADAPPSQTPEPTSSPAPAESRAALAEPLVIEAAWGSSWFVISSMQRTGSRDPADLAGIATPAEQELALAFLDSLDADGIAVTGVPTIDSMEVVEHGSSHSRIVLCNDLSPMLESDLDTGIASPVTSVALEEVTLTLELVDGVPSVADWTPVDPSDRSCA
ncbi:hypothetical protein OVA14_03570 [Agrococcus sp. SL85]|uniref:hypothetical protein n=1 Tax=Agrococcus sp. SL85 TaxID=2995141 RepID=UPI00226CB555|nr:hypothetical protein [Agrococcus sp. SL85]WAC66862.1 hypothetical protein OVA14_03570 [Agrococcus sp. SL85]